MEVIVIKGKSTIKIEAENEEDRNFIENILEESKDVRITSSGLGIVNRPCIELRFYKDKSNEIYSEICPKCKTLKEKNEDCKVCYLLGWIKSHHKHYHTP